MVIAALVWLSITKGAFILRGGISGRKVRVQILGIIGLLLAAAVDAYATYLLWSASSLAFKSELAVAVWISLGLIVLEMVLNLDDWFEISPARTRCYYANALLALAVAITLFAT